MLMFKYKQIKSGQNKQYNGSEKRVQGPNTHNKKHTKNDGPPKQMLTEVKLYMHCFSVLLQLINLKVCSRWELLRLVALLFTIFKVNKTTNHSLQSNIQPHLEPLSSTQSLLVGVQCEVPS